MTRNARRFALLPLLFGFSAATVADEVSQLDWCPGNRECLEWSRTPSAIGYRLFRGERPALPGLLDVSIDSCIRGDHDDPTSGRAMFEAPDPGGLFWFLAAACASAGKRLCTDNEWLRACRGPTTTTYPYGDVFVSEACSDNRATHPLVDYF